MRKECGRRRGRKALIIEGEHVVPKVTPKATIKDVEVVCPARARGLWRPQAGSLRPLHAPRARRPTFRPTFRPTVSRPAPSFAGPPRGQARARPRRAIRLWRWRRAMAQEEDADRKPGESREPGEATERTWRRRGFGLRGRRNRNNKKIAEKTARKTKTSPHNKKKSTTTKKRASRRSSCSATLSCASTKTRVCVHLARVASPGPGLPG